MTISTNTQNYPINVYLSSVVEATPTQDMNFSMFARQLDLPERSGNVILVTRFNQLPPAIEPVQPASPSGDVVTLTNTILPTAVNLYSQSIFIDTRFVQQNQLPILTEAAVRLAVSIRTGQDIMYGLALQNNASAYNCRYGTSSDSPTEISAPDLMNVFTVLKIAACPFAMQGKEGSLQFNTQPVQNSYFALANHQLIPSLTSVAGFQQTMSYPIQNNERGPAEFGSAPPGFRFWTSANVPVELNASAQGNTVLNTFVGGGLPYCGVSLGGNALETIYRPPEYSNAAGLQISISTKSYFGTSVTQNLWVINIRSTSTFVT